ncbi:heterokaryon incompatibility protein-domain-containing protein [Triangularia verruculosa]|uniref:Heterokaryon incompatibility protein-domain-containing protein n=1 Tax=Triangularia verruculosa TaxID=2587418 RepID=A0AAN6XBM9_9PEZI|nr:heterokaryon incompatibility protein-domain-containing protein [Triangularia verruculosa]
MPRRLLLVSSADIFPDIRVVRISTATQYIALSYCWGGSAEASTQTKSMQATIADHERRIQLKSLPKTIQDAVAVTRELGIDYIWVDALCIIQDDEDDRNHEIARMGAIYANAYVTLSASGAIHCAEGFLELPLTEYRDSDFFEIPLLLPGESKPCFAKASPEGMRNVWVKENGDSFWFQNRELLHTRGWTFQETFLSPRLLMYTSLQPYWVCREAFWSCGDPGPMEYLQSVFLKDMLELRELSPRQQSYMSNLPTNDPATPAELWRWGTIIHWFSSRQLTLVEDKPLALHAVRETFTENDHGLQEYALGLFRSTAYMDLLWHTRYGADPQSKRLAQFPSWTWMSFDGGVMCPFKYGDAHEVSMPEQHHAFEILQWPTCDQFGRMLSSSPPLQLKGLIKEVAIPHQFWKDGCASAQDMPCFSLRVLGLRDEEWEGDEDRIGHVTFDQYRMPSSNDDFEENPPSRYKTLQVLLVTLQNKRIGSDTDISGGGNHFEACYGLVIAPGLMSGGRHRRIGFYKGESNSHTYFEDGVICEYVLD